MCPRRLLCTLCRAPCRCPAQEAAHCFARSRVPFWRYLPTLFAHTDLVPVYSVSLLDIAFLAGDNHFHFASKPMTDHRGQHQRRRHAPPAEWSCPLCTLLNSWRDRRCAACDQERESPPAAAATAADDERDDDFEAEDATLAPPLAPTHVLRGVFFSSAAATTGDWRKEPRLTVNRRKRPLPGTSAAAAITTTVTATTSAARQPVEEAPSFSLFGGLGAGGHSELGATAASGASGGDPCGYRDQEPHFPPPRPAPTQPVTYLDQLSVQGGSAAVAAVAVDTRVFSDEEDDGSQPNFQLLGSGMGMFASMDHAAPVATTTTASEPPVNPTASSYSHNPARDPVPPYRNVEYQNAPPPFELIDVSSPPQTRPQHAPPAVDANYRYAAPSTQTSSGSSTRPAPVPASVLQQGFVAASRVPVSSDEQTVKEKLARAGLDLSDSDSNSSARGRQPAQKNRLRRNLVESPEPTDSNDDDEDEEKAPAGATWECSICTNYNSVSLARCELCDTKRGATEAFVSCASQSTMLGRWNSPQDCWML